MGTKNVLPFDEATLTKLEIFQKYFETWLPTFIMLSNSKPIQIFDLFAGSGYDQDNKPGSPIKLLEIIKKHQRNILNKKKKITLFFNDLDKDKIELLKENVQKKIQDLELEDLNIEIKYSTEKFKDTLKIYKEKLENGFNIIFIDQYGFKEVDEQVFQDLIRLDTTDFLFFISSTHIHRFAEEDEIKKYHPKFDSEKIKHASRKKVHNIICEEFRKYVPSDIKNYHLIPFSLMKEDKRNVYGLIFVTKHIRGADKFLNVVWKQNTINGNANFDIDNDEKKSQTHLFSDDPNFKEKEMTKIDMFKYELEAKIIKGEIKNNREAYIYTIGSGHIPQHAKNVVEKMKKEGKIFYEGKSPLISYEHAIRNNKIINFILQTNENN